MIACGEGRPASGGTVEGSVARERTFTLRSENEEELGQGFQEQLVQRP